MVFDKKYGVLLVASIALIAVLGGVLAEHTIRTSTGGTSYNFIEDAQFVFNISVNNTDAGDNSNITQVNITLPASFTFVPASNGTDAGAHTFSNTTTVLSWLNGTNVFVGNGTWRYFFFNATAATPGNYNITVTTLNATGPYYANISITINDTTVPSFVDFGSLSESDNANLSRSNIVINITATDNGVIDRILVRLYNSTTLMNTSFSSSSPFLLNYTGLADGTYRVNATVNDTYNNLNTSTTRLVVIDAVVPLVSFQGETAANGANASRSNIAMNVSVTEPNEVNVTFRVYNSTGLVNSTTFAAGQRTFNISGLAAGTYTYNVTVTSHLNQNTTTRTITLDTTSPVVTLLSPANGVSAITSVYNFTFNFSDSVSISSCSLILDGNAINTVSSPVASAEFGLYNFSLSVATHNWSVNCTDSASNVGNSTIRTFTVTEVNSNENGGGGGGSSGSGGGGAVLLTPTSIQLADGYERTLSKNWKVKLNVSNQIHHLQVLNVTPTSMRVNISSTPQQATLAVGEERKFEVTGDGYYDVLVRLNSIRNLAANVTIRAINEVITPVQETPESIPQSPSDNITQDAAVGEPAPIVPEEQRSMSRAKLVWSSIGIFVVLLVIILGIAFAVHRKTTSSTMTVRHHAY